MSNVFRLVTQLRKEKTEGRSITIPQSEPPWGGGETRIEHPKTCRGKCWSNIHVIGIPQGKEKTKNI